MTQFSVWKYLISTISIERRLSTQYITSHSHGWHRILCSYTNNSAPAPRQSLIGVKQSDLSYLFLHDFSFADFSHLFYPWTLIYNTVAMIGKKANSKLETDLSNYS